MLFHCSIVFENLALVLQHFQTVFLDAVEIMMMNIRTERICDWDLHLQSVCNNVAVHFCDQ